MVIGVLKEIKGNEYRVAAVPATVHEIVRHGHTVYVETGAGVGSGFSDAPPENAVFLLFRYNASLVFHRQ